MKFFFFNVKARRYMYLHMIYAVLIVSWPFFPVYLFRLNFTLVEVGALFSLAGLAEVVFTFLAGRALDKIPCNYGLALIEVFGAFANIVYGLAQNFYHIIAGRLLDRVGWVFNPSYLVYENEAYKEDYETIYQYHLMAPELIQLFAFPLFGFLLTYVFNTMENYRFFFIFLGVTEFFIIIYILKVLPRVEPTISLKREFRLSIPRQLYVIVCAEVLLVFGGAVGSQFILIYYLLVNLNSTFFTVTIVEAVVSFAIILTIILTLKKKPEIITAAKYGIFLMIVYAVLMSFAPAVSVVLIAYFIESVGNSLWFPRHRTLLMTFIPEERRGEILGSIQSLNKLVSIAAPFSAALIASHLYVLAPFVVQLATLVSVYLIYGWIGRNKPIYGLKE